MGKRMTMMKSKIRLVFFIVITLNLFVIHDYAGAQLEVKLIVYPPIETIQIGSDPREIGLIARVNQEGVQFNWQLEGSGRIEGDLEFREIKYIVPNRIRGNETTATITVTATDRMGESATARHTFTLLATTEFQEPPLSTVPIQEVIGMSGEPSVDWDLTQLLIQWKCVNGDDPPIRFGHVKFGVFFHYGHQDSVRRRSWKRIARREDDPNLYFLGSVAVQVVPYVTDIMDRTRRKYVLVPTGFTDQKFTNRDSYCLVCTPEEEQLMRDHPNWYPTVLLTPIDREYQNELKQFLEQLPHTIEAHKFIPQEIDFPATRTLGGYLKKIFPRAKEQNDVVFLRAWQHGVVTIVPLGFGGAQEVVFEYEPTSPTPAGEPPGAEPPVQEPTQNIINVRINFPPELKGIEDLKNHVRLTECASVNSSEDGWSHVTTTCPRENLPQVISIDGFKAIPIILETPDDRGMLTIDIQAGQMVAQFKLSLAKESDVRYTIDESVIDPGESPILSVPITRLQEPITFMAQDAQQGLIPECNFRLDTLSIEQAIRGDPIELPVYKLNTITWPINWDKPQIQLDSGKLESIKAINHRGINMWEVARSLDRNITLSWGPGWEDIPLSTAELNMTREHKVTLDKFIPRLPLVENDPWLREDTGRDTARDPCEAPPVYSPQEIQLTYCKNTDECENNSEPILDTSIAITRDGNRYRAASLGTTDWSPFNPLPTHASVSLEKTSSNPVYKEKLSTPQWRLDQSVEPRTLQEMEVDPEEKFPIAFEGNVHYDLGTKLMLFDNLSDCKNADITQYLFTPFMAALIENLRANACTWALLVKDERRITKCVRGERRGDTIVFIILPLLPLPDRFDDRHWIIAVEDSEYLGASTERWAIQEALIK